MPPQSDSTQPPPSSHERKRTDIVERHKSGEARSKEKQNTAVLAADVGAPNGPAWRRAHETRVGQDR